MWSLLIIPLVGSVHLDNEACCRGNSIPQNWTTSQSSHYEGEDGINYTAERAIDGKPLTCAHTNQDEEAWWRIDLLGVHKISAICIKNIDHHNSDITGVQIYIGSSRTKDTMHADITKFTKAEWNYFHFNNETSGRYITVRSPKSKILVLCEVKICSTRQESPYKLIKKKKTWDEALNYCRDNDMDLASILNEEDQAWAELEAKQASTPFVWLGLHYTCVLDFWFWVEDHCVVFTHWASNGNKTGCDMSGAMSLEGDYQWFSQPDEELFYFICAK